MTSVKMLAINYALQDGKSYGHTKKEKMCLALNGYTTKLLIVLWPDHTKDENDKDVALKIFLNVPE